MSWQYLPHEEQAHCLLLVWNEGEWEHPVSQKIFGKQPKCPLIATTLEECQLHFAKLEKELTHRYVLKRLALRNLPSFVLEQELAEHYISERTIKILLNQYIVQGYIDNEAWLKGFVAQHTRKHIAPQKILWLLRQKGAPEDMLAQAQEWLKEENSQKQCQQALDKLLKTRFRSFNPDNPKEKQKIVANLARKGFSFENIQAAMERSPFNHSR